jgi:hypothetical protein
MNTIYNYIDSNGIQFYYDNNYKIKFQQNENDILQKIELESDPTLIDIVENSENIISKHSPSWTPHPILPDEFNLTQEEQEKIVIDWLFDTTGVRLNDFKKLLETPILNELPFLLIIEKDGKQKVILCKQVIDGNLTIRQKYKDGKLQYNWINTLGRIEQVNGDMYIDNVMQDMGNLITINGNLIFSNYVIQNLLESLYPIKVITGDLIMKNTYASLGIIEEIGGNLNLRKSKVRDLGDLKKVGGNVLISKCNKDYYDFSNIEVLGKIRCYNDVFTF